MLSSINRVMKPETGQYVRKLSKPAQLLAGYVGLQESAGSLAHIRFAQDTIVNWLPKVFFSRSLADFTDMSFLEIAENVLVYYGGKVLGEGVFRKPFSKKIPTHLKEKIPVSAEEILKDKKISVDDKKKLLPVKTALALSAMAIPLAEYSLNFVKNLLTLKMFKQADFNNIANLNKEKKEDLNKQKQVKDSAKKHIGIATGIYAGCLALAALFLTRGKKSKALQSVSEFILAPGNKLFKPKNNTVDAIEKATKKASIFNKYFGLDFDSTVVKDKQGNDILDEFGNKKRKLALSTGQLMSCVTIGFAGYMGAAKDRGKQNMLEVAFRYPIVTFYVITGADLFIKGFKSILRKKGGYEHMVGKKDDKNFKAPKLDDLPQLAKELAKKKGTTAEAEFKKLFKQKATIIGVPTLFSLIVMGVFVAAYSRFFTKYRYNKEMKAKQKSQQNIAFKGNTLAHKEAFEFKNNVLKLNNPFCGVSQSSVN